MNRPNPFRSGFTLVEILIVVVILGILAAVVLPQFSNASHTARENTLKDDLRFLRTQITIFKAQHTDVAPGYPGCDASATPTESVFINQMTKHSNAAGELSDSAAADYPFGPYLSKIPANPINGKSSVMVIANGSSMPSADNSTGWIYKPSTNEFRANDTRSDESGKPYFGY